MVRPLRAFLRSCLVTLFCLFVSTSDVDAQTARINALDLARLVDIDGLSVSPDRRVAVFQERAPDPERNTYALRWMIARLDENHVAEIAAGGEPILAGGYVTVGPVVTPPPVWSPDSKWFAYLRLDAGSTQLWRTNVENGITERISSGPRDVRSAAFTRDGTRVLIETEPSAAQIEVALALEGRNGFLYDQRFGPSYSRRPSLPADLPSDSESRREARSASLVASRTIRVVDLDTRSERDASASEIEEFNQLTAPAVPDLHYGQFAAVSPHGAIANTEALDPQRQGLFPPRTLTVSETSPGRRLVCEAAECTSQYFRGVWWRNSQEVVFARAEGVGFSDKALYRWRVGDTAPQLIWRTSGTFVSPGDWDCTVVDDRLVCFLEEANRPRRLVTINLQNGEIDTVHNPNPTFERFSLPAPTRVEFQTPEAGSNYGLLITPRSLRRPVPLVVVTYRCGGFLRGGTGDEYPVYPLVSAGYAVLCFNLPDLDWDLLATMQPQDYEAMMRGEGDRERRRVQESLAAAIAHATENGSIDSRRIAITGLSAGGELVMYALFHRPSFAAAIASGTEFGPSSGFLYGPAGRDLLRRWGLERADSARWNTLSITRNAIEVSTPLLLNVADHELIDALHPHAALQEAERAVEMHVYPDEYHQKWQPSHRLAIYRRNMDWLDFWLRGQESGASNDPTQYSRWREMRVNQCRLIRDDRTPWYCRNGEVLPALRVE